jgi:hypothetical protein
VKGESATGKSYVVGQVADFFPQRAVLSMTSASDKALFHLNRSLQHRVLIFGEQHGMSSERLNYYIRELLSNGSIEQYSVQPGKGGHTTKHQKKKGPTSFVTTATSDLHPENETRLLALPMDESPEATAEIMKVIARGHDGTQLTVKPEFTPEVWKEFHTWIAAQGNKVEISFAQPLAELIEPTSVRLRRDFGKLLSLIAAHALLHRKTRTIGANGVIAEVKDYRAVWKIMRKIFALTMEQSVDPVVRQTVEAVYSLKSATITVDDLAGALGIVKSNAARRFRKAEQAGFLMNRGAGPGKPYAIAPAAPLPGDSAVLPTPTALRRVVKNAQRATLNKSK